MIEITGVRRPKTMNLEELKEQLQHQSLQDLPSLPDTALNFIAIPLEAALQLQPLPATLLHAIWISEILQRPFHMQLPQNQGQINVPLEETHKAYLLMKLSGAPTCTSEWVKHNTLNEQLSVQLHFHPDYPLWRQLNTTSLEKNKNFAQHIKTLEEKHWKHIQNIEKNSQGRGQKITSIRASEAQKWLSYLPRKWIRDTIKQLTFPASLIMPRHRAIYIKGELFFERPEPVYLDEIETTLLLSPKIRQRGNMPQQGTISQASHASGLLLNNTEKWHVMTTYAGQRCYLTFWREDDKEALHVQAPTYNKAACFYPIYRVPKPSSQWPAPQGSMGESIRQMKNRTKGQGRNPLT